MRRTVRLAVPLLIALLAAAGCRRGAAPIEPAAEAPEAAAAEGPVYGATGADNLRVVPVEIEILDLPEGWHGLRFAAVSDFQLGLWPDNEAVARAAMELAAAQNPDFIALLGDYVARGDDYAALDRVLEPVRGRTVFAVLGNVDEIDDARGEDTIRVRTVEALERNGVRVLRNARAGFERNGDTAYVAGVEPYLARRPDWRRAEIYNQLPAGPRTAVVLSHMPVVAVTLPTDRYPAMIAGHTFCGEVEVPGTPRLRWVNTEVFPGTSDPETTRIYRIRGATVFITCGVGHTFVPARYAAPPEVAIVTLLAAGVAAPDPGVADERDQAVIDSLMEVYRREAPEPAAETGN
jgi:uncharacterized protein